MPSAKSSFLDKVLGKIGRLDAEGLEKVVRQLARERDFLETLFNTIEDGILVVDRTGAIVYLNQAVTRLLGLQRDHAEGQPVSRYLPGLDWARIASLERSTGPRVVRHELEVEYPRPRLLRLFATPLDGDEPGGGGVALILHDATEARQRTAEAIETERSQALTLLAASVAHEIGNPLNALHIHLQLMERELRKLGAPAPAPARASLAGRSSRARTAGRTLDVDPAVDRLSRYVGVAKGEIARLDYIVTQFLQALRPSPPQFRPANLNTVVRESLELLGPELENRGLIVEERLSRTLPEAPLDPAQIKQALVNLIKNSLQATTRGGILTLETGTAADGVWVSVADTGVGIPPDQLSRLAEPFFTTKRKGTGLGLMIVYRIVREHGGRIDVQSDPGKGTTFRLWLPVRERPPRLLQAAAP